MRLLVIYHEKKPFFGIMIRADYKGQYSFCKIEGRYSSLLCKGNLGNICM